MRSALRTVIAVVVALAAWLTSSPAWAQSMSAPQCDRRAATTFAPVPTLDAPTASVDIGEADDDGGCFQALLAEGYDQGRSPMPDADPASSEAILNDEEALMRVPFDRVARTRSRLARTPRGVRHAVERPPRA